MRRRLLSTVLLATVALAGGTVAGAPPTALKLPDLPVEKTTLPNGLQLILHVDHKLPVVHVNLWYHVGSKNEKPGRTGFAHLFEHMMLQGSKNAPEDYFSLFQRIGARGGRDSNGTTWPDRTSYFTTAPSGTLEFMLWVHSDYLKTLPEALTQAKLDNQRAVVRNERRENTENVPYGKIGDIAYPALFPAGHPYSWDVIGSHEDLMAASLDDVKDFFHTYYAPNNLSLVITGDFDPAEARRLVDKYFGSIPPGPSIERPRRLPVKLTGEKVIDVEDRVPLERTFIAWMAPAIGEPDEIELSLAESILSTGLTSRLQKALLYDQKLCTDLDADSDAREIAGLFWIDATARPGASLAEIERIIDAEVARLAKDGPTAAELQRAQTTRFTRVVNGLQDLGAFGGKGDLLNYANTFYGDPNAWRTHVSRLLAVKPAGVRAAVARWLANRDRVIIRFHPANLQANGVVVDRTKAPGLGADKPFTPPAVAENKLDNGLQIYVVERHDLPTVAVSLLSRAGSVLDPPGKAGLATLTTTVMKRGVKGKDALALASAWSDLGSELGGGAARERSTLAFQVVKANVKPALELLSQVVRAPSFPEDQVERERKLLADQIQQAEDDANYLAGRIRDLLTFGADHPYGRVTPRGEVVKLTRADLAAFHAASWKPDGAALVFVGDITPDEARALAAASFGGWSGTMPAAPVIPPPAPPSKGRVVVVDRPGAAQTVVVGILTAPPKRDDDYYSWRLANEILGGGTGSRLYLNLRQNKGYSYGYNSSMLLASGPLGWTMIGGVQTDKTKESVVEVQNEEKGLQGARPFTAKELEDARNAIQRGYGAGFATNADVANRIADVWTRRWPISVLQKEMEGLSKASLEGVQAAAKKYSGAADMTWLLVGDRQKIEPGLRSLKLGELLFLDVEGKPLKSQPPG